MSEIKYCSDYNIYQISLTLLDKATPEEKKALETHVQLCAICLRVYLEAQEAIDESKQTANTLTINNLAQYKALLVFFHSPFWQVKKQELIEKVIQIMKKNREIKTEEIREKESFPFIEKIGDILNRATLNNFYFLFIATIIFMAITSASLAFYFSYSSNNASNKILAKSAKKSSEIKETIDNFYIDFDESIDQFLSTQNYSYLSEAEKIANLCEKENKDKYLSDLLLFYKSRKKESFPYLLLNRSKLKDLFETSYSENPKQYIEDLVKLEDTFLLDQNKLEAYKTRTLRIKAYVLTNDLKWQSLIKDCISYAQSNNYRILECYFLLWQAKSKYSDMQIELEKVVKLSKELQLVDAMISSQLSLAALYQISEKNIESLLICEELLQNEKISKPARVSALICSSLIYLKFNEIDKSRKLLVQGLEIASKNNQLYNTCIISVHLGLSYLEEKNYKEAFLYFASAKNLSEQLKDDQLKAEIIHRAYAYEGKIYLNNQKYKVAYEKYLSALEEYKKIKHKNNYVLAEINQGIAKSLEKIDSQKAQEYIVNANYYQDLAFTNKEEPLIKILSYTYSNNR